MAQLYKTINLEEAENFVQNTKNVWWENYDLIIWKQNPGAWAKKNGMLHQGKWGNVLRIPVSQNGTWRIPTGVKPI